jgi:hypothetical protein
VLDGLLSFFGRLHGDFQVALDVLLADVFRQSLGAQSDLELLHIALDFLGAGDGVFSFDHLSDRR